MQGIIQKTQVLAFAIDLVDDPAAIAEYRRDHTDVSRTLAEGLRRVGVLSQRIFLCGNRLFMVLRVPSGFDYRRAFAEYAAQTPGATDWDNRMRHLQVRLPWAAEGEWWTEMQQVYDMEWSLERRD
ncbi:MAG: L-rhamnose mutarotase [Proteobacteria bacterium]|nr:L-rhamnose mutarotase [Pseudomonadota bacterium]